MSSRPTMLRSSAQRPGSPVLASISRGATLSRRFSAGRSETSPAGLRPAARGPWLSTLASAFRGAPSPWRVSAGPVGGIIRRPSPGRAGAMLARSGLHLQGRAVVLAGLVGPVGGINRGSPPGRAGARLARSRGPRAPALQYLHTIRQDRCLISLEVRRPSPSWPEVPSYPADCAGLCHPWWPCYNSSPLLRPRSA